MLEDIKNIVFDYDGVFTSGKAQIIDGKFSNEVNIKDITGLKLLKERGYRLFIINSFGGYNSFEDFTNYTNCFIRKSKGSANKLEVVEKWMSEFPDMTWKNTAVIGDDSVDYPILSKAFFSACPSDAIDRVKEIVDYQCASVGGECVREFCDYIIAGSHPIVDGLICVKLNSERLPFKNICPFGNTTLLENKIDSLLQLPFLRSVVVNTESDKIIYLLEHNPKYTDALAREKRRLVIVKRDVYFSQNTTHNRDFVRVVTEDFTDNVLYSPVTMPFVTLDTYKKMYKASKNTGFDSVILTANGTKGGGHEGEKHDFCFAASLMSKQVIDDVQDFIGRKPYFQPCSVRERMDIDDRQEFDDALYSYYNTDGRLDSKTPSELYKYKVDSDTLRQINFPKLIDVTIRDGGFSNHWRFSLDHVRKNLVAADKIGLEYFELGYFMDKEHVMPEDISDYRMLNLDVIKKVVKGLKLEKTRLCAIIDYWRYDVANLPTAEESGIDLIRVTTYIETTKEAIEYVKQVKSKGYKVSLNVMCGSYLTTNDHGRIMKEVEENTGVLDYLYIADTYGSMKPNMVKYTFEFFQPLRQHLKLGFHIHDNMQVSMANLMSSIGLVDIVDGSYGGMGRGCGNLKLEDTILYGYVNYNDSGLDIYPLLDLIDTDQIRHTIVGLLNIHPYRLRDCKDMDTLRQEFMYLSSLDKDSRYKFK